MYNNWIYGLKMAITLTIIFMFVAFASAGKVTNMDDHKETSISSQNNNSPTLAAAENREHVIAKRAWNQLHGGWGKRSNGGVAEDEPTEEELEDMRRLILRYYSDQLNRIENSEYIPEEDDDSMMEKRAWNSMNQAWGKRDWSQLRSNGWGKREPQNWNNMKGLWGKRAEKWNKLSSAWGRKK